MKNILKITLLSSIMLSFVFCQKKDSIETDEQCVFEELHITDEAKYFIGITKELWRWNIVNNKLIIKASNITCDNAYDRVIEFDISKDCPQVVENSFYSCSCDAECLNPYTVYSNNINLQKWIPGELIIGTHEGTDFWVDLTEYNKY